MRSPESKLPETRERRCPACQRDAIAPAGHILAAENLIKIEYRCEARGVRFLFVRKPLV